MPQTFLEQFFLMDPANPPPVGSSLSVVKLQITDQNDDNDFDRFNNDSVNGSDIVSSWPGDRVTVNVPGVGNVTYTGTTFYLANGQRAFTPTDGQVLQDGTFAGSTFVNGQGPLLVNQMGPPCFTRGTLIDTPEGPHPVESLCPGDRVLTRDSGAQPVRWIGMREVDGSGAFAPVRFAPELLGRDEALLVSPQHRMLLSGWEVDLWFGAPEVLAPALHLVDGHLVTRAPCPRVTYLHLMFDRHEIVSAGGMLSESFHPGGAILAADGAIRAELAALFPDAARVLGHSRTARRVLRAHEAAILRGGCLAIPGAGFGPGGDPYRCAA